MDIRKKLLGPEHPSTLNSMGNLASTYRYQGKWNEAEQLEAQVMDLSKKLLGPDWHPHALNMMSIGNLDDNIDKVYFCLFFISPLTFKWLDSF